jgi:hypothetical protein
MGDLTSAADILDVTRLKDELDQARDFTARLLKRIGDEGVCAGCGLKIFWIRHLNGNIAPYEESGEIHFVKCPKAGDFRKPKHRPEAAAAKPLIPPIRKDS